MGCDIHACLEIKNARGEWFSAELYKRNRFFGQFEGETEFEKVPVYWVRNYELFSALCGVRDYTGQRAKISEPKGMPEDATSETLSEYKNWESDAHSVSWNTLAELYKYQSENTSIKRSGFISAQEANNLDKGVMPTAWCQGTSNKSWVWREWEDDSDVVGGLLEAIEDQVTNAFFGFNQSKEDVRVIYWFDN